MDFDRLLAAARRQARIVVAISIVGLLLGLIYIVTTIPEYTAISDLFIDSQKDRNALSASIAELTFDSSAIDTQVEVLKSEKIALAVIASMNLTTDPEFMGGRGSSIFRVFAALKSILDVKGWFLGRDNPDAEMRAALQRSAIDRLKDNLDVRRVGRTYVLAIQYTSPDPDKAAAIANAFADAYLTEQFDAKFAATRRAAGWLQTRISELKQRSIDSDLAIQRFKAANGIVVTGGDRPGLISDQRLTALNQEIVGARADSARADARYAQIEELLKTAQVGVAVPDSLSNPVVNDIRTKYLSASKMEAQLENKLGARHLQVIALKREMAEYDHLIYEELQRIAESYRSDAEVARAKEQSLLVSMSGLVGQSAATNRTLVQLRELERESDTYRSLYQTFMQRYQEALQQQSFPVTEARVITAATPPRTASYPRRSLILTLSFALGGMAGAGVGALREHRDRVFRVATQVRDELGLNFLGLLQIVTPSWPATAPSDAELDPSQVRVASPILRYALDHPLSAFAETLHGAKVAIDLALGERKPKIVGVISVLPDEGKSTVAKNLSSLLAHLGAPTLLIDADLRSPGLTPAIAGHAKLGLLEALREETPLADLVLTEPDSGLNFLPTVVKKRVLHSSELLASTQMRRLLVEAGMCFQYIVLDLPPLGPVVDVRAAASLFDAFLLVAEWGRTPRAAVHTLFAADDALYNKCVGVVYNKVDLKRVNLYESRGSKDYYYERYAKYHHRREA
jgi:succinoglycan biosynthesis transport protein ExoP